jgi:predicted DNA-binding transcriptional regulator AlpA
MSEPSKIVPLRKTATPADDKLVVTLSAGELRDLIRQEVRATEARALEPDKWLDAAAAAKLLSVSEEWLYHNAKKLPFASKIGHRLLRFSQNGLQKWMESKRA